MAKSATKQNGSVNKSQAIRDALAVNPDISPKQLSADLNAQGIQASPAYISMIKTNMKAKARKARREAAPSRQESGVVSASELVEAKKLVDRVGGIEKAESLLGTLRRLL